MLTQGLLTYFNNISCATMAEPISFQSSWTLAQSIIIEISDHLRKGRNYWLNGNLDKYYWEFECVVRVLKGLLDENEKKESNQKETDILVYVPMFMQKSEDRKKLIKLLKEYDELVMTFIHKHHLDMPPKRDRTVMIA